jgi:hypothetical protein
LLGDEVVVSYNEVTSGNNEPDFSMAAVLLTMVCHQGIYINNDGEMIQLGGMIETQ